MSKIRRFGRWLTRDPVVGSFLPVLVALLFACVSTSSNEGGLWIGYSAGWQIAWSCALIVPVIFRRSHPQGAALAFAALTVLQLVVGPSYVFGDLLALVMLFSVIAYGNPARSKAFIIMAFIIGIAAAPIITWGTEVGPLHNPGYAGDTASSVYDSCRTVYTSTMSATCGRNLAATALFLLVCIITALAAACFLGYRSRMRLATASLLRERNEALADREQEDLDIARTAERARIARDMHDVVAHTLSTIIVQSDGGRYAGANDPGKAREIMETIRHESKRAQHDMDGLLSTFGGASHAGYDDIAGLVAQADETAHATKGKVIHVIGGDAQPQPERLSDKAQSALYHAVQEALTNARKYAGDGVTVEVEETWNENGLRLVVRDDGNGAAATLDGHRPGYGITGMRERIEAVGGTVAAGPRVNGGFEVDVTVPFERATKPTESPEPVEPNAKVNALPAVESSSQIKAPIQATSPSQAKHPLQPALSSQINGKIADGEADNTESIDRKSFDYQFVSKQPSNRKADNFKAENYESANTQSTNHQTNDTESANNLAKPDGISATDAGGRIEPNGIKAQHHPLFANLFANTDSSATKQQAKQASAELNWAERVSGFFAQHYLLADAIIALVLMTIIFPWSTVTFRYNDSTRTMTFSTIVHASTFVTKVTTTVISLVVFAALVFRRRFPRSSAAAMAVTAAFALCFVPEIPLAVFSAPISLYSVCLYGKGHSRRWATLAALIGCVLFSLRFNGSFAGYPTLADWAMNRQRHSGIQAAQGAYPRDLAGLLFLSLAICAVAIGAALWVRASGTNAMVLQARHEALEAESAKKQVLAANNERERIGAQIRGEVSETLAGVIAKADAGLAMLDDDAAAGVVTSPEAITSAFRDIGEQGRAALAHMRELLRVLRETGGSDDNSTTSQPLLHPVAEMKSKER
ncbi:histidine kinase [Bifidobacterium sp. ESL0690]|uniref:sensor histidine kinase n=1 Tax=Bifidobacterium sp. ESL0690 TaxID=2983214 RepID=UPI0023F6D1ED|nr:histidine kinase [Bifidobacterium sp. ESL0690]WEV47371.1 histidine kinase [Bifidobacterium sp. ESL0690]